MLDENVRIQSRTSSICIWAGAHMFSFVSMLYGLSHTHRAHGAYDCFRCWIVFSIFLRFPYVVTIEQLNVICSRKHSARTSSTENGYRKLENNVILAVRKQTRLSSQSACDCVLCLKCDANARDCANEHWTQATKNVAAALLSLWLPLARCECVRMPFSTNRQPKNPKWRTVVRIVHRSTDTARHTLARRWYILL